MVMFMVEKDLVDLDQQIKISDYLEVYQSLIEMNKPVGQSVLEYNLQDLTKTWFTYHKKKDKSGKYIDDGKCRSCGKDRQYLIVKPGIPPICYNCYQAARGYKKLLFDPLHLKSKMDLTAADCKRIVKYMSGYAKKKLVALAAVGAYLAIDHQSKK